MGRLASFPLKDIGKIVVFLLVSALLGALIAPELYWACRWLTDHGLLAFLRNVEFRRVYDRAILIAVLSLLWPLIRWLNLTRVRELGLERDRRGWKHLFLGLGLALGSMAVLGAFLLAVHRYNPRVAIPLLKLAAVLPTAATVAVLEEFLFRGALQGLLERSNPEWRALLFVAALFSLVHFLKPPLEAVAPGNVTWLSGFETIPKCFWQFRQPSLVLGGFTTLFIAGLVLGYSRARTRALWMPVGLHAGWVIGNLGFPLVAMRASRDSSLWFGRDLLTGIGPVCVLLCTGFVVAFLLRLERMRSHE